MSRIDILKTDFCPDGVRRRPLSSIARRNSGTPITAGRMRELHIESGPIRVFAAGATVADVAEDAVPPGDIIREPSIIVKSRGHIGFTFYDKPFTHKNELWSYTVNDSAVDQRYVYHYLLTQTPGLEAIARATSVKLPQLSVSQIDTILIPLPPLEVQQEISRVLDRFVDLESEMRAELAARGKQFEYYREQLLTFKELKS